jgi:LuxR family maltose regulon positive regulatory protein
MAPFEATVYRPVRVLLVPASMADRTVADRGPFGEGTALQQIAVGWHAYWVLDRSIARRESAAAAAVARAGDMDPAWAFSALTLEALVDLDDGASRNRRPPAVEVLRTLWQDRPTDVAPDVLAVAAPAVHRVALGHGWTTDVRATLEAAGGLGVEVAHLEAIEHQVDGRVEEAQRLIDRTLDDAESLHPATRLRMLVLTVGLLGRRGELHQSHRALTQALALAEPAVLRPFVEHRDDVRGALMLWAGRFGRLNAFADHVRLVLSEPGTGVFGLTERESQVLAELPSLSTVEEIAISMSVSPNTVKTHLRNLYRKLGATSRREALAAARLRGML